MLFAESACCALLSDPPRGGYPHMYAIWVCAAVKGMVFKQFSLG